MLHSASVLEETVGRREKWSTKRFRSTTTLLYMRGFQLMGWNFTTTSSRNFLGDEYLSKKIPKKKQRQIQNRKNAKRLYQGFGNKYNLFPLIKFTFSSEDYIFCPRCSTQFNLSLHYHGKRTIVLVRLTEVKWLISLRRRKVEHRRSEPLKYAVMNF